MADDYSAHLSPAVFALRWPRRYVFIPHGGGVTPVVQTPDTDLNQHVKREYTDRETGELLRQMRDGISVPQLRQEECIDIMVDVCSNMKLHLNAAKGYLRTVMPMDLDGLQAQDSVRETSACWSELGMRANINAAVKDVREEHNAIRLNWAVGDVQRIIRPYPINQHVDAVLRKWRTTLGSLKANVHMTTKARGRATNQRTSRIPKRTPTRRMRRRLT